jgi:NADPH:quinone reductase-like Zn-dependent oxidoreductase
MTSTDSTWFRMYEGGPNMNVYLRLLKSGGSIVSYGGTAGVCKNFNLFALFLQQIQLKGTAMSTYVFDFAYANVYR